MISITVNLENFKSYKGNHIVKFNGFTCIIGPNGTGKSNLAEAVCFALGMNALRTQESGEVISIGCKECKVSVNLEFDNLSLEDEANKNFNIQSADNNNQPIKSVLLCRKIFVNKSTYYINGVDCSYEEYNNFLETLNIFVKQNNFFISQKEIMFSSHDIVTIIERMSGSYELKELNETLKKNYMSKSKEMTMHLELRKNALAEIKAVNEKKNTLKKYQNLSNKMKNLQKRLTTKKIKTKFSRIENLKKELQNIKSSRILTKQNDEEGIKSRAMKAQQQFLKEENILLSLYAELDKVKGEILSEENRKEEIKYKNQEIVLQNEKIDKEVKNLKREIEEINQEIIRKENIKKEKNILDKLNKEELEEIKNNYEKLKLQIKINEINKEKNQKIKRNIKKIIEENEGIKKEINILENRKNKLITERNALNKRTNVEEFYRLLEEERKIQIKIAEINHIQSNKCITFDFTNIFSGVIGRVVNLIQPIHQKYSLSLSVLLSGYENALVVENDQVALSVLEYVKEQRMGKITILPLSSLKVKKECLIIDKLIFDKKIEKIIKLVFSDSLIVESVTEAKLKCYKENKRVVTLNGELFLKNGFISAGEVRNNFWKDISSDKEPPVSMSYLREKLSEIERNKVKYQEIEILLQRKKEIEESIPLLERELEEKKEVFYFNFLTLLKLTNEEFVIDESDTLNLYEAFIKNPHFIQFLSESEPEENVLLFDKFNINYKDYEFIMENKDTTLLQSRINLLNNQINILENKKVSLINHQPINLTDKFKELKLQILNQESRKEEKRKEFDEVKQYFDKIKQINTEAAEKNERCEREAVFIEAKINSYYDDIIDEIKGCIMEDIDLFDNNEEGNETEKDVFNNAKENNLNQPIKLSNDLSSLLEMSLKNKKELIKIIKENVKNKAVNESERDLTESINNLKEEIDLLIPYLEVENDNRIKDVLTKYELLRKEMSDVKRELDAVKKERVSKFMDCFTFISNKISEVYKKLIGEESNALLVLENKSDPFSSVIKYFVMPPNKRFREVNELSGGERTMACLALLLSLKEWKRPPLYIFDEVDAHLDEENIERMSKYVKDLQCICVTHQSSLFGTCDNLIGVYLMNGISQIIGYKNK